MGCYCSTVARDNIDVYHDDDDDLEWISEFLDRHCEPIEGAWVRLDELAHGAFAYMVTKSPWMVDHRERVMRALVASGGSELLYKALSSRPSYHGRVHVWRPPTQTEYGNNVIVTGLLLISMPSFFTNH